MKIYTRTGDTGDTGLFGGPRVRKDHARIEAYGTIDELNAVLGMVRSQELTPELSTLLETFQNDLFTLGAELATPDPGQHEMPRVAENDVARLENKIDHFEALLPPLKQFILPSGSSAGTTLHVARAVCRRAERRVVTLQEAGTEVVSTTILVYLNRLSDLLFVLARFANQQAEQPEIPWQKPSSS
ncbi:MAG: cob(I)yrinic acid a,c-diamide adenosyltransferase [Pirellulaceae bacterium]|nr:cob(I)yrinic acid a,c-diamide adenosyltransferase [Pirellulaceae bacterium]